MVAAVFLVAASAPIPPRWSLHAGGGIAGATAAWDAQSEFTEFAETGRVSTFHDPRTGPAFEGGLWHAASRHLGADLTVAHVSRDPSGSYVAALPHPLYAGRPRSAAGDLGPTAQRETAVHLGLVWSAARGGFTARLSGGPSYFLVAADLAVGIEYTHAYPYDTVRVTGLRRAAARGDAVGGHAGLALERRIGGRVALGAGARWSRATVPLSRHAAGDGDVAARVPAGGVSAIASIRLYF
jgi:hypothetical protein